MNSLVINDILAGIKFASASQAHLCKSKYSRMRNWYKALNLQKRTRRNHETQSRPKKP